MSWQRITRSLLVASAFCLYRDDQKQRSWLGVSSESSSDIGAMTNLPPAEIAFQLDYHTSVDPTLQRQLEQIDASLRTNYSIAATQTAVGVLDLTRGRLAMIHPDEMEYAASVAKLGILLAYFELNPDVAGQLDPATRHDLGLMAKTSSNEMASKFSHGLGLRQIQGVLD